MSKKYAFVLVQNDAKICSFIFSYTLKRMFLSRAQNKFIPIVVTVLPKLWNYHKVHYFAHLNFPETQ